jgi:hypothetical protein
VIEGKYILSARLPPVLQKLIGTVEKVELAPRPPEEPVEVQFKIDSTDGSRFEAPLRLFVERAGTKEALLSNRRDGRPWTVEMLVASDQRIASLEWNINLEKGNAHHIREAVCLWAGLSKPGLMKFAMSWTGIEFMVLPVESAQPRPPAPEEAVICLFDDLDQIQRATGTELFLQSERVKGSDAAHANAVAWAVRTGRSSTRQRAFPIAVGRDFAEFVLTASSDGGFLFFSPNQTATILGQRVPLGPAVLFVRKPSIRDDAKMALRKALEDKAKDRFDLTVEAVGDCCAEWFYLKFLPADAEIPREVREFLKENNPQELAKGER